MSPDILIFLAMAVVFLVVVVVRFRRSRVIRRRMQEEERIEQIMHGVEIDPNAPESRDPL